MKQKMLQVQKEELIEGLLSKLEALPGDMEIGRGSILKMLDELTAEPEAPPAEDFDGCRLFDREKSLDPLASDEAVVLRSLRESVKAEFLEVLKENSSFPNMFSCPEFVNDLWTKHLAPESLYCSIHLKESGAFVGYCGVKDARKAEWELVIELLRSFHRQGCGYRALRLLMDRLRELTGQRVFLAKVEPENTASQGLMEKLGGIPDGIDTFLIRDEEQLRRIEEDRMDQLDENLTALSEKFHVQPRLLLSHVVVYRFSL